ncbi:MAG: hypothetical protein BGN86_17085 [Caulobacterales bacterium 68-7]|nr:MAG: hypothetical protein BGN86_17085 [Caulobacterales bacterium 68-7]
MWIVGLSLVVLAVLIVAERLWAADRSPTHRGLNAVAGTLGVAVSVWLQPVISGVAVLAINRLGGGLIDLGAWPWPLAFVAYLLAMDLGEYLFHRAQHVVPWMWRMHSLHHSDPNVNATTAVRHFWAEPLLKGLTIWLAVGVLFKVTPSVAVAYALVTLYNFFTHANLPVSFGRWSWVWNAPAYHRLHHSSNPAHYDANFAAMLPIFDVLLGSYRRPERGVSTGLDRMPTTLGEVLTWPVRNQG